MSEVSTDSSSSVDTSSQEGGGEVVETQSAPAAPLSLKEKFKLTVDGEEIEEELDWNDKETIKNRLQLAAAAKKRIAEGNEAKRKAYDIVKQFENDPESMLAKLGPKGREIAEKYLLKQIQDDMMTPEQKTQRTEKEELEALRKEKSSREENEKKSKEDTRTNELAQSFQATIISALEKSGLPKTPALVKRMAGIMHKNLDLGLDLTADDLVSEIKGETGSNLKAIVKDMDGEQLIAFFGEDAAKKIRMADVKKIKDKNSQLFGGGNKANEGYSTQQESKKPMSMDEWKADLERRIGK